ncbi:DUF637 domain-containing protein [Thiothrix lacustris]|uniref:DUF637 domain-containing protein n=1 Tax=Thiothrix lacustris TaxID=525917 RepID=A0ABY9MMR8_9GAMM|nr:DUF637 domain-containing protein [Thiothrix lacustris]WML89848.1 DUF637 domain-containing protein [Thiothrix lacustris]
MINNITTRTIPANVCGFRGATTANQAASMLFNNDLFETTHADFQAAIRQDFQVTQGKTYNVSGTDLLDAIEENTRLGHTAGVDNNKNGAFDPSRDRHGLGKVVDKFTDKVLDNPIVRTVAQIAQFTPLAPVASVVNTVVTARDVVKAVDEGNIKSLASTVISAGLSSKLSNSLNLAGDTTKISVAQQLQKHAMDGLTRATVSTVVEGGDFDDQPKSSLKATAANIVSQIGANKIGDLYSEGKLNNVTHKLAHTALGFAAGTVANGDGISGAVGGLAGSVAGEYFQSENAAVLASAASAALLGKDPLLAANVASTADRFNRQLHQTEVDWVEVQAKQLAKEKGITEAEAFKLLMSEAVQLADYTYEQLLPDNREVRAWLEAQGETDGVLQGEPHWIWGTKEPVDNYSTYYINREVVSQNAKLYAETVGISPERAFALNRQNLMGEWGEGYNDTNVKEKMENYQTVAEFVLPDIMLIPEAYAAYKLGQYGKALALSGVAVADAYTPGKLPIGKTAANTNDIIRDAKPLAPPPSHPAIGKSTQEIVDHALSLGVSSKRDQLILWAGLGKYGPEISNTYAIKQGGTTLQQTPGGSYLAGLDLFSKDSPLTLEEAVSVWEDVSRQAVKQSSGQVRSVLGQVTPQTIYQRVEKPELWINPNVTGLDELQLKPKLEANFK